MKNYDIHVECENTSQNKGFKFKLKEAKIYVKNHKQNLKKEGTIFIVCNETNQVHNV